MKKSVDNLFEHTIGFMASSGVVASSRRGVISSGNVSSGEVGSATGVRASSI